MVPYWMGAVEVLEYHGAAHQLAVDHHREMDIQNDIVVDG